MKAQLAISEIITIAIILIVVVLAVFALYIYIGGLHFQSSISGILKSSPSAIEAGNESIIINLLSKLNLTVGKTYNLSITVLFPNKTQILLYKPFVLVAENNYSYELQTDEFLGSNIINSNINSSAIFKLIYIKNNNTIIHPINTTTETINIFSASYLNSIPYYYLKMEQSPTNAGIINPSSEYLKAGTPVQLFAKNSSEYGFIQWFGYGNGNYSGTLTTPIIILSGNVTELAEFGKFYNLNINTTQNGMNVNIGGKTYTTNVTARLIGGNEYTYNFPAEYNFSNGNKGYFESASLCNQQMPQNGDFIMSSAYANCTLQGIYKVLSPVTINIYPSTYNVYTEITALNNNTVYAPEAYSKQVYMIPIGTKINMNTINSQAGTFESYLGTGQNSYTGTNQNVNITIQGPLTENVTVVPNIQIFIYSPTSMEVYFNGVEYTTNTSVLVPYNKQFNIENINKKVIPGYVYENWGTRYSTALNSSATTCQNSGTSFTGINTSNSKAQSCSIYFNKPGVLQYELIFNESLNGGKSNSSLKYGNIHFSNGTIAQHSNWIDANTNITFYATNSKPGYGFVEFTGPSSDTINGTTVLSYSGPDSQLITPTFGYNQNFFFQSGNPPTRTITTGYTLFCQTMNYCPHQNTFTSSKTYSRIAGIDITNPVIETANYVNDANITTGSITIPVQYIYYTYSETYTGNGNNYNEYLTNVTEETGTQYITFNIASPYTNFTKGIGNTTLYYVNGEDEYQVDNYPSGVTESSSYPLSSLTTSNDKEMPTEYQNIINTVFQTMTNDYPAVSGLTNSPQQFKTLSFWFNLSGTNYYFSKNLNLGDGTDYYGYSSSYSSQTSQFTVTGYYYGFSSN